MRGVVRTLLLLIALGIGVSSGGARAANASSWISYDAALRDARTTHQSILVLYGKENCPYVGPARTALDTPGVAAATDGRYVRAYVDMDGSEGAIAKRRHIVGTPTLQFLEPDGEEIWRRTPSADPDKERLAIEEVNDGKSYDRQERLLREGTLDQRQTLELARTYLDRGWDRKGKSLLQEIEQDPARFDHQTRQEASFYRMEYATPKQRLRMLPRHIEQFPEDVLARINLGYATRNQSLDKRRAVMRQIADGLPLTQDPDIKGAGLRLIVEFALYSDPSSAAWAMPYALQRIELAPRDMEALTEYVAVAVKAGQRDKIADAERVALAANAQGATSVQAAIAAGMKQAETGR